MNIRITVEDILKHNRYTYWPEERIRKVIGDGKTLIEVLNDTSVDAADRIWCVTRLLPGTVNRRFAADCALHVAHLWNMPPVVKKYLKTLNKSLRKKAALTVSAAYFDSPSTAAHAARSAIAAGTSVYFKPYLDNFVRYRHVFADCADAAAHSAAAHADAAEREWQINRLIKLIGGATWGV